MERSAASSTHLSARGVTGLLAAFAIALAMPMHTDATARATQPTLSATVRIKRGSTGPDFAVGAVGLSIEAGELATPDLNAHRAAVVRLMRLLGPGVLRVGGNSVDESWWTATDEPPPSWATSVITPADLTRLDGLLIATNWHVVLGVDLGHFDPARAEDEASVATQILGPRLLGFEVGNEPDLYGTTASGTQLRPSDYDVADYLQELGVYTTAMRSAVPGMTLYGPDVSQPAWIPAIAADPQASVGVLTEHVYPTLYSYANGVCPALPVPTAAELLSPQVRAQESADAWGLVTAATAEHIPARISETNDTGSCDADGGPDTSPVFASALWALDWALRSASLGVSGINFHGGFGVCGEDTFSPACAANLAAYIKGTIEPRPEYYGLLAARILEGGHFIPVQTLSAQHGVDLTAYATLHADGEITIALENLSTTTRLAVAVRVPGYRSAAQETLAAPSLATTTGITLGGASFTTADSPAPQLAAVVRQGGSFRLQLAPASAVIATMHP
jgi:hypothetical protein